MLEIVLFCLFEGYYLRDDVFLDLDLELENNLEVFSKFWRQLQMLLKKMLVFFLLLGLDKIVFVLQVFLLFRRFGDVEKIKEFYKMFLKFTDFR